MRAEVEKDSNLLYRDRSKSSILIGGAVDRYNVQGIKLTINRAGVLENVESERNAVFENEQVHEKIKTILSSLLAELNQTEASNDAKEASSGT